MGIARWNGASWSSVAGGVSRPPNDASVWSFAEYDDGTGLALFVGGSFTTAGTLPVNSIARWSGGSWSDVGGGVSGTFGAGEVVATAVFDSGNGPELVTGGHFLGAGGVPAPYVATWNGSNWSAVPSGLDGYVEYLQVFDVGDGAGPRLIAAGGFGSGLGATISDIATFDGVAWSALEDWSSGSVRALGSYDDGTGPGLYIGGRFLTIAGQRSRDLVRWSCVQGGLGLGYCSPAAPNSTGRAGVIDIAGSPVVAQDDFTLLAHDLPANQFGYFLVSDTRDLVVSPGGSAGSLCLGGTIGRLVAPGQVRFSGTHGVFELPLDLTRLPAGAATVVASPGQVWHFQTWYRDRGPSGQPISNFTDARTVRLQ